MFPFYNLNIKYANVHEFLQPPNQIPLQLNLSGLAISSSLNGKNIIIIAQCTENGVSDFVDLFVQRDHT